jgi:hypothetical protein
MTDLDAGQTSYNLMRYWKCASFCMGVLMTHIHSLPAEWLPVSIAPSDEGDLKVCVIDYDGIVLALAYPCHKNGTEWVDASNKKYIDIQPTHWRKWTESY